MRVLLLASVLLTISLAGCSGGSSLQGYLMQSHETPEGCALLPYNSEEGEMLQAMFNWTGNPGRVDNEVFEEDGVAPTSNMVSLYECDGGDIASIALRFASADDATQYTDGEGGMCDEGEAGVVQNNLVIFVEGDDDIAGMSSSLDQWIQRVSQQVGAANPCGADGMDDEME